MMDLVQRGLRKLPQIPTPIPVVIGGLAIGNLRMVILIGMVKLHDGVGYLLLGIARVLLFTTQMATATLIAEPVRCIRP